jgi:5-formyltetrahydrofolate cyclo-ligase
MDEKGKLRKEFRELRNQNPGHDDYLFLLEVPEVKSAKVITSYFPMNGEPNLISLNESLIAAGKTLLLPRIRNHKMEFAKYEGDLIQSGKFHEPPGNIFIGEIQVCLIPATAIDRNGVRLGQGGGYYDQFLVGTSAYRIGIIHDREFVKKLPQEWFDQKVEAIATESGFQRL